MLFRTIIAEKTEILSFTVEPPNPSLDYKCEVLIPICIVHPRGPSKSPFSELANVLNSLIIEVENIAKSLTALIEPARSHAVSVPRTPTIPDRK